MIYNNFLLHNVEEITNVCSDGKKIQRIPKNVCTYLNPGAQSRSFYSANCELRFVCDGPARVTLSSPQGAGRYFVSYGSFMDAGTYPLTADPLTIELKINERLHKIKGKLLSEDKWSPFVVRIMFPRQEIVIYKVEGNNVRPPEDVEMPRLRYLAYGTSITEGGRATMPHLSYAAMTAMQLGADVVNLGMAGACHAEEHMFDYIASRNDWDIATLELSINMLGFECDEFRKRVKYGINTVAEAHPGKPIACITLFPHGADFCGDSNDDMKNKSDAFRQILREEVSVSSKNNLHLIEGSDILDCPQCLTSDMIHPSDMGMMRMATNLTTRLKKIL